MSTYPDGLYQFGGTPVGGSLGSLSMGNVYYVMDSSNTLYNKFCEARQGIYDNDGTWRVHTTIQSALDACTTNRDDYVIVMPYSSDYDITAAITLSKSRIRLLAPSGIGWGGMSPNMVRVHQNTASTGYITVTGDATEIAGFFFKQDSTSRDDIITLSSTRWCNWIHDNFFAMSATGSTSKNGIVGTGACNHFVIENNYFTNYNPGLNTGTNNDIAAFIGLTSGSSTRGVIRNNLLVTGVNTTVAAGISLAGTGMLVMDNHLHANTANGGNDAGTFTAALSVGVDVALIRNTITGMNEAGCITGATVDSNCVLNYDGYNGGTVVDQDTADH